MNIENAKQELSEWILSLTDDSILEKIKFLKDNQKQTDWWNEITEEEKASIEKGLNDIKEGRVTPHSKIKKEYGKWL